MRGACNAGLLDPLLRSFSRASSCLLWPQRARPELCKRLVRKPAPVVMHVRASGTSLECVLVHLVRVWTHHSSCTRTACQASCRGASNAECRVSRETDTFKLLLLMDATYCRVCLPLFLRSATDRGSSNWRSRVAQPVPSHPLTPPRSPETATTYPSSGGLQVASLSVVPCLTATSISSASAGRVTFESGLCPVEIFHPSGARP